MSVDQIALRAKVHAEHLEQANELRALRERAEAASRAVEDARIAMHLPAVG
jgi:hypothetical protein